MRRTIARRLVESKTTIPHFTVTVQIDMDALADLRRMLNEQLAAQQVKLSVNDFVVRAAAVALWTTQRLLPLERGGELARSLSACRSAALRLTEALAEDERFAPLFSPELDIVVWAVRAESASEASERAQRLFDAAAELDLHLALARFPRAMCEAAGAVERWDREQLTCLRACVMKAEQEHWVVEILDRLEQAASSLD